MGAVFSFVCSYNYRADVQRLSDHNIILSDTIEKLKYDISKRDKIIEKLKKELNSDESFEDLGILK